MMMTKERVKRMFEHKEADRVPITDGPWGGTLSRWKREGMPEDADWRDYFGVDKMEGFSVNVTPRYESKVVEENERYVVQTTEYGVTLKYIKGEDSTPEFLDYTITSPQKWEEAKKRINHDPDRVDWKFLDDNLPKWHSEGRWVDAFFSFGFDITQNFVVGTELFLISMLTEPEWVEDIYETQLNANIALFDLIWEKGYRFDGFNFCDDMGYKGKTFFSPEVYRRLEKPFHKRAFDWARDHGLHARLHSCGYIEPFIPDLIEIGLEGLNPLEVKSGMDPIKLKQLYGDKLVLNGGINAALWDKRDEIIAEIERVVPIIKENGGFIFSSDHSIPNSVSLNNMKDIVACVKKVGNYG